MNFLFWRHVRQNKATRSLLENHKPQHSGYHFQHHRNSTANKHHHNRTANSPFYRSSSSPSGSPPASAAPPVPKLASNQSAFDSSPPLSTPGSEAKSKRTSSKKNRVPILASVIGGAVFLLISSIGIYLCKTNKVANVRPWATGISGQLQKAFVTGKSNPFFTTKLMREQNNGWKKQLIYTCILQDLDLLPCLNNKTWSCLREKDTIFMNYQ